MEGALFQILVPEIQGNDGALIIGKEGCTSFELSFNLRRHAFLSVVSYCRAALGFSSPYVWTQVQRRIWIDIEIQTRNMLELTFWHQD